MLLFIYFFRGRLPTLNNYCVICDQPHVFAVGNMLKPAVCSRELCCFSFQQLGVGAGTIILQTHLSTTMERRDEKDRIMSISVSEWSVCSDAADNVAIEAEVVDLLVCMASAAAHSPRCNIIFNPFPLIFDPDNPKKQILSPERPVSCFLFRVAFTVLTAESLFATDCTGLRSRTSNIRSFSFDRTTDTGKGLPSLESTIDEVTSACLPPLAMVHRYRLFSFLIVPRHSSILCLCPLHRSINFRIIASNRAHIVKLHETKHITSMKTQH